MQVMPTREDCGCFFKKLGNRVTHVSVSVEGDLIEMPKFMVNLVSKVVLITSINVTKAGLSFIVRTNVYGEAFFRLPENCDHPFPDYVAIEGVRGGSN